ncbi:flavin reductase family protein [bacterium]|nr:MAG: flavin reductase family protein [bacterium]
MFFDLSQIASRDAYKLLTGVVVPRPIAFVTSVSSEGIVNAAPYSFFNMLGSDPPTIAIGVGNRPEGGGKDTARNIEERSEFVVNIVDETLAPLMNESAVDFPSDWSEIEALGLEISEGQVVKIPRLAQSPASLECHYHSTVNVGNNRIILGVVVGLWIRDEFVDAEKFYVWTDKTEIIGRGGGGFEGGYFRLSDPFGMRRQSFAEWQKDHPDAVRPQSAPSDES